MADGKAVMCRDRLDNAGGELLRLATLRPAAAAFGALRNGAPCADMPDPLQGQLHNSGDEIAVSMGASQVRDLETGTHLGRRDGVRTHGYDWQRGGGR